MNVLWKHSLGEDYQCCLAVELIFVPEFLSVSVFCSRNLSGQTVRFISLLCIILN